MGASVGLSCVGHFHDLSTSVRELGAVGFVACWSRVNVGWWCLMSEQGECWVVVFDVRAG